MAFLNPNDTQKQLKHDIMAGESNILLTVWRVLFQK